MNKGDFLLGMMALCVCLIFCTLLIANAISSSVKFAGSEIAKAIRGHEPDITITVPTTRVVQGGLPDPIREVVR